MVTTDNRTADRWLQRFPNRTIFTLLAVMVLAVVIGTIFFVAMRPSAGGATQPDQNQSQPMQAHPQ
ncbi:hypothetical protein GOB94_05805 [Granulicella sp. 5B5]|uniref:hypothetical protein n=1 Tax=Granulicella sp. 5B5 TaxID=1617967 RepID=UPI0015F640A1|nr:hypothetical protein [Granulicella sp. 5B5]QMV18259.1 hypothetical protein GOB94_05805 [Granulicella sp. 5B5]